MKHHSSSYTVQQKSISYNNALCTIPSVAAMKAICHGGSDISGVRKNRHASSTAYSFCQAHSFNLKFLSPQIQHVLHISTKFH